MRDLRKRPRSERGYWTRLAWTLRLFDGPNFTEFKVTPNGRVYTVGTRPLQNLPGDLRKHLRARPGYKLMYFDYNAQEPRLLAALSGDRILAQDLNRPGMEFYAFLGGMVGVTRQQAKAMFNAFVNGGKQEGMARAAYSKDGWDPDPTSPWFIESTSKAGPTLAQLQTAAVMEDFIRVRYGVAGAWLERTAQTIKRSGKAYTYTGRCATIKPKQARRNGVSFSIQGTGADLLRVILPALADRLGDMGRVVLPVHDGLLIEIREDYIKEATDEILAVMMNAAAALQAGAVEIGLTLNKLVLPVTVSQGWPT